MLSIAERHKYILDNLNKYGFVRITDVANQLGVTKVTIRKDVKILESKGLLYKVHGSARPTNPHVADTDVHLKDTMNPEAKRRIAARAVELVEPVDSIILSSGSTVFALGEEIRRRTWQNLNIVTPFLRLGVLLNDSEQVHVVQLGGSIHKTSLSVLGEEASRGLDVRKMMKSCSRSILVVDSSKFGQRGFGRICSLEDVDVIVTDARLPEQTVALIEEAGIDLIVVDGE